MLFSKPVRPSFIFRTQIKICFYLKIFIINIETKELK